MSEINTKQAIMTEERARRNIRIDLESLTMEILANYPFLSRNQIQVMIYEEARWLR